MEPGDLGRYGGGTAAVAPAANPSPGSYRPAVLGNLVFFTGRDAATGNELWVYDLAANSDPQSVNPFAATDTHVFIHSFVQPSRQLVVWDRATGTAAPLLGVGASMFCAFEQYCLIGSPTGLWRSDGTSAGTVQLSTTVPLVRGIRRVGSRHAFYVATSGSPAKNDLWRTDGTAAGTMRHVDLNPIRNGFSGLRLCIAHVNGGVYWNANHELYGDEPTWMAFDRGNSQPIGTSCGLLETRLAASDAVLGQSLTLRGTGVFAGALGLVVIMLPAVPPIPFGPTCFAYGDPSFAFTVGVFGVSGPTWNLGVALPGDPSVLGMRVVFQGAYLGGSTPGGLVTTNGVLSQVGF